MKLEKFLDVIILILSIIGMLIILILGPVKAAIYLKLLVILAWSIWLLVIFKTLYKKHKKEK